MDTHKGLFPLHQAAADGDMLALRRLLADSNALRVVDMRNRRGNTALMLGAETAQVEAVRTLLAAGANPLLYNSHRLLARDFCEKRSARRASSLNASEVEIQKLLLEAERAAEAQGMVGVGPLHTEQSWTEERGGGGPPNHTANPHAEDSSSLRCPVCGAAVRRRMKIDFLEEEDEKGGLGLGECSLHVTTALHSKAVQTMRCHPKLHYHNLLDMRSLRKEISESWGALVAARSLLDELQLDPADVRPAHPQSMLDRLERCSCSVLYRTARKAGCDRVDWLADLLTAPDPSPRCAFPTLPGCRSCSSISARARR